MTFYWGIIFIVASVIVAFWRIKEKANRSGVVFFCLFAAFMGIVLLFYDRIIEITVENVGSIKASAKDVAIDAEKVKKILEQTENQSATIGLVAKQATEVKKMTDDLVQKNLSVDKKLKDVDETLGQASQILLDLSSTSEFTNTVINAQNDDRKAFDKLDKWANDKSYPLASRAREAWVTILEKHSDSMFTHLIIAKWPEGVNPSELKNISDLRKVYESAPFYMKAALVEYIWERQDIPKRDRLIFLVNVLQHDASLTAVEYAGRFFKEEMHVAKNISPVEVDLLLNWWGKNKDTVN